MTSETQVSAEEFAEHVEFAGAYVSYTCDGFHYYVADYCGKLCHFGKLDPVAGVGYLDMI